MLNAEAIVGGPGCGKTRRLIQRLLDLLARGVPMARISVLTFTRAARQEVLDRLHDALGLTATECPWVRTIHATALRLRGGAKLMTDEDWDEFARRYGYDLSPVRADDATTDADLTVPPRRKPNDLLRFVSDWGRNRRLEPEQALGACPVAGVELGQFLLYVRRYQEFKAERSKLDFTDLLEHALQDGAELPVRFGFVDEAQDLSALQSQLVEQWFARCERVYVAGDDDQAIYVFQGGRANWFLGIAREGPTEVLEQSHRLPAVVLEFAQSIIRRNADRLEKHHVPTDRDGEILRLPAHEALQELDGSRDAFVLARNRFYLWPFATALIERKIPFRVEGPGGPNPLGDARLIKAIDTAVALTTDKFETISAGQLDALFRCLPKDAVPKDARAAVRAALKTGFCFERYGLAHGLGLGPLIEMLRERGALACLRPIAPWKISYLGALLEQHGRIPRPRIILTSIHGAKGREADLVVLISDMTRATHDEYTTRAVDGAEAENRVFYVGVTRTQRTLVLVEPQTKRRFDFPAVPSAKSVRVGA